MDYAPPVVTIQIEGSTYPVPFLESVTVRASGAALIRDP